MADSAQRLRSRVVPALTRRIVRTKPGRRLSERLAAASAEDAVVVPSVEVEQPSEPEQPHNPHPWLDPYDVETWLTSLFGEELERIEEACADGGPDAYRHFRELDDEVWTLLLSRRYTSYPNILALLPEIPGADLQLLWNGAAGLPLLTQSKAFYRHAKDRFAAEGEVPLERARVLDFGCGWGRLTRFFARDVEPGALHGCDPVEGILDSCREARIPAELSRSDFVPERLPVEGFDLAFSFSVFTHISEAAARTCLEALHAALNPGGVLMVTIRPPAYLDLDPKMHALRDELEPDPATVLTEPRYLFVPHPADPSHPQYEEGEMTYGDSVISLPYVCERWSDLFELRDVHVATEDIYQVTLTLKRVDG